MAVYLIRAGLNGPAKIGKADNAADRMFNLQAGHYETLHLLRVWEGGRKEEAVLHARFKHLWIRGDWFTYCPAMLDGIGLTQSSCGLTQEPPCYVAPARDIVQMIERLGGAPAVAKVTGTTANTVHYWGRRGSVPSKYFAALVQHAQAIGIREFDVDTLIRACSAKQEIVAQTKPVPSSVLPDLFNPISTLRITLASDALAPSMQEHSLT